MKATFALLADREICNLVRKIAWEVNRSHGIGLDVARLEPHVSLKQPFEVRDFAWLEAYMVDLAASIPPFDIHISGIQAIPTRIDKVETGILWFDIENSPYLGSLHHRLNRELERSLGPSPAEHDGEAYHFHMTIAIGRKPFHVFQSIANSFQPDPVNLRFQTKELAMFVYDDDFRLDQGYMTYKILPLG
jgi:2'-5' RNA ligase